MYWFVGWVGFGWVVGLNFSFCDGLVELVNGLDWVKENGPTEVSKWIYIVHYRRGPIMLWMH